ncbi:MAG: TIGR04211 family SH3 domain-containing protein [Pseudomonadales bacterium]|jgi:SH3 domain protein|nr:TIGR04211 family SH3 domain-containing protein [Pseudomonadales bacterium]MCP5319709.1 TIGR04211 family SH3 domain-containing protein [Pseudomonadales bacterium]MCP5338343.1 TIGR04211 family SH3 domain-containing protein [Pseudomonadales bacterium]
MLFRLIVTALLGSFLLSQPATAQDRRYVDDTRSVPLRSDAFAEASPIRAGVPSGSAVTLLSERAETGWALVRTEDGTEGWIPTRYLKREAGPRYQIINALRQLGQPDDGSVALSAAIEQARKQLDETVTARDALLAELAELKKVSGSAQQLDASNREMGRQLEEMKNRIGVLEAENQRLHDDAWQKWFINGVWATGIGGVLTLLLPRLVPQRRRRSEWT